jgi:carbamoyltransferase
MNEPIVETPEDALWCLLYTGLDCCIFHDRIVYRSEEYTSVLDLYPYIASSSKNSILLKNNELQEKYFNNSSVYFSVKNRWGSFFSEIDQKFLSVLKFINGKNSCRFILSQLRSTELDKFQDINESQFIKIIGLLRRKFIINFNGYPLNELENNT